jgi:hypothetical protein
MGSGTGWERLGGAAAVLPREWVLFISAEAAPHYYFRGDLVGFSLRFCAGPAFLSPSPRRAVQSACAGIPVRPATV